MNLSDLHSLPPTLTADEVAELFSMGRNQVYEAARKGELPVLRLGRSLRFPTARILEMLGITQAESPKLRLVDGEGP